MASAETSGGHFLQLSIPTRDAVYYISDGNTVLLVESTLFKVLPITLSPFAMHCSQQVHDRSTALA